MTSYRKLEKVRRQAQEEADRIHAVRVIVEYATNGVPCLYIRPPKRARNLVRKHSEARILAAVRPR